jgi:hypothetical protein
MYSNHVISVKVYEVGFKIVEDCFFGQYSVRFGSLKFEVTVKIEHRVWNK